MCRWEAIQWQSGRQVSITKSSPTLNMIQLCGFCQVSGQRARVLLVFNFALESESEVTQSCPTLCNPMDCSLPGSLVHGIFQARILEWVAISFSRGSFQPRDRTQVSSIVGRCFTIWATRKAHENKWVIMGYCNSVIPHALQNQNSQYTRKEILMW